MVIVQAVIIVVGSQATVTLAGGVGFENLALGNGISRHERTA